MYKLDVNICYSPSWLREEDGREVMKRSENTANEWFYNEVQWIRTRWFSIERDYFRYDVATDYIFSQEIIEKKITCTM